MILGFLYQVFNNNYAIALVLFTIIAKLILLPSSIGQQKRQAESTRTRAKIAKIKKKFAGDQKKMNEELSTFYQKEGYSSMFGGCGSLFLQFPIIIGLYGSIYRPISYILRIPGKTVGLITSTADKLGLFENVQNSRLYEIEALSKVDKIQQALPQVDSKIFESMRDFDFTILGLPLGSYPRDKTVYMAVPVAAFLSAMIMAIYTFFKQKKRNTEAANNMTMGCMMLFTPLLSLWLAYTFPIGIGIYWALNSLLSFVQMLILDYTHKPEKVIARQMVKETAQRRSKEKSLRENNLLLNSR
ncbi:MAG: YidC/Oxa1 family membrane protein insertase, partial [Oscillospiraceae bacterium]|jgi:YidC/Oxa1 family membrane protein insertase|nr:YidC/Oxa1 family membrane protein insertase [Oscillospiraceae bacterium]